MLRKATALLVMFTVMTGAVSYAGPFDWFKDKITSVSKTSLSDTQVGAGLKEALRVGIENAIKATGKSDGYLANQAIKILMPENLKNMEGLLRKVGFGPKVDEFILSMNRAAEKAAPLAADIFAGALTELSIEDAQNILQGGQTAATDYFKSKTYDKLSSAFTPAVEKAMNDYGVTKKFQEITGKYQTLPFVGKFVNFDIDKHVVSKTLDGLFYMLGQEENKIRTDPAARVTSLLKDVFK